MKDVEKLANFLHSKDYNHEDLLQHLKAPQFLDLIGCISFYEPANYRPNKQVNEDLLVLKVSKDNLPTQVPPSWHLIELSDDKVAIVRPILSWLNLKEIEVCVSSFASEKKCNKTGFQDSKEEQSILSQRAYPSLPNLSRYFGPLPYKRSYSIPISIDSKGTSRVIEIPETRCKGKIESVSGVSYDGKLPSNSIIINDSGEKNGRIILSWTYGTDSCALTNDRLFIPLILETDLKEQSIRDYFKGKK